MNTATTSQGTRDENSYAKPGFYPAKRAVRHLRNVGRDTLRTPEGVTYETAAECEWAKEDSREEGGL